MALTKVRGSGIDADGQEVILDADGDTTLSVDTDDRVDIKVAGTDRVAITSSGLGVNVQNPTAQLHVEGNTNDFTNPPFVYFGSTSTANSAVRDWAIGAVDQNYGDFAFYCGASTGADAMISGNAKVTFRSDGRVSIGTTDAGKQLYVYANNSRTLYSDGWIARLENDGNAVNLYGMEIFCGSDDASGTNYPMRFCDGNGDEQGFISFSGGTVSYGTFTANHPCIIPDADNTPTSTDNAYPYGTLLETTSIQYTQKNGEDTERGIVYNVIKTQSENSKKVLGVYGSSMNQGPNNETNLHQALVLGDGHILCNNAGGNISIGDGICSSSTAGIGQKATANPSMIIGIAQEDVTFSGSETKLVAVQYGLQQFIPWS